jgi:DNA-binding GntR family transcriptional regulator
MTGQKMPRYAYLAEKYNLSRISVQKIVAGM